MLSLFSPFSSSVLHSSPLSFVDFLGVIRLTVGLGIGLGRLRFVRGFGFWSRRRSGLQFAPGGLGFLSRCRSRCGLISGWAWVDLRLPARGDFAWGGLGFLSRCRSECGLISAWAWVLAWVWVESTKLVEAVLATGSCLNSFFLQ